MPIFEKKAVLLDSIKGCLGVIFQMHQTCPSKELVRGKFEGKIAQNSRLGGLFWRGEIAIRVCSSVHTCVQHQY